MRSETTDRTRSRESDAAIAERARGGDGAAFGLLLARHWATATRVARRAVSEADDVADILQESALAAYLNVGSLLSAERFQGWFCGIVLNYCRMHHRQRARMPKTEQLNEAEAAPGASIEGLVEDRLLIASVREAVEALPAAQRQAALLVFFEGWDTNEAAAALGVSSNALKVRLHRARRALRSRFSRPSGVSEERVRRSAMVEVEVYDVHVREGAGETPYDARAVVMLREKGGERTLPIWIGEAEGMAIALELESHKVPRPLTHDLTKSLLDAVGVQVESVTVNKLVEDTFYAAVSIRNGGRKDVDARPSDAINLALRAGAPLFVDETIFDESRMKGRPTKPERTGSADIINRRAESHRAVTEELREETRRRLHEAWDELGIEFEEE